MNSSLGTASAIVAAIVAVLTLVVMVRKSARETALAEARERTELTSKAYEDGQKSRNDEVALLRSQRDDARRDRDTYRSERDQARRDLSDRDRRTP